MSVKSYENLKVIYFDRVEMQSDGKIGFVQPSVELPNGLTENAVRAARSIKFEPAWKDGKPVTTVSILDYGFSIY